jgi:tetratricopeptide (TPR) repeat protein
MKKVYSILTSVLILSMFLMPMSFYGQEDGADDAKKESKSTSFSRYLFLQAQLGASWFQGDLAQYGLIPDLSNSDISGGLGLGYQFTPWLNVHGNLMRGFAKGQQQNILPKNLIGTGALVHQDLKMDMDYWSADLQLGLNISNLFFGYKERLFSFGIHGGVGQTQFNSRTYDQVSGAQVAGRGKYAPAGSNAVGNGLSDRKIALTVPIGFDLNFAVAEKVDVYGEYTYTWMATDWADNVKHGEKAVINDAYTHFNIGVRYKFISKSPSKMANNFDKVELMATPNPLEEVGDSVLVTVKGTFPPKYFIENAVMCFNPILTYEGGQTELEPMYFKGEDVPGDGTLISYKNGGSFEYTSKVPYVEAMAVSELMVSPVIYTDNGERYESCADAKENGPKAAQAEARKLADGVIHLSKFIRHTEVNNFAPDGYQLETIITQEADIFFQVNLSQLNKRLPLNKDEDNKDKLANSTMDIDKGWLVKNVTIDGWASPEGEETFNEGLSAKRAATAEKFMKKKIGKDAENMTFILNGNGPDWNGFMTSVEGSQIADKNAIINVVNSADVSKKEEEIRNMILIYPELERDILPPLRRAVIKVNTYEPKKPKAQIAEFATSDPSQLSVNEILYAATLTDDLNTKKQVYANAMNQFPKCWRAVNNAAAIEIEMGNIETAEELLMKAFKMNENSSEVRNNMGIVKLHKGDYAGAQKCFAKAQELGADANYNLGVTYLYLGEYAKAESMLASSGCDFNKGLAQLMNRNYAGAQKTLSCVEPQDAETNYIQAVAASMNNDKENTLKYLGNAIKADAKYKKCATNDMIFLKYRTDASFQALVN